MGNIYSQDPGDSSIGHEEDFFDETGEHLSDTRMENNFISLIEGKYFLLGGIYILHVVPDGCTEC